MPCIEPDWPAPPGVFALCTTRQAGCSAPPYDSLNLALHVDDDPGRVGRNRELLDTWLPPGTRTQWLEQEHGTKVVEANPSGDTPRADACWSGAQGIACAVLTADCLPVLFCTVSGKKVAAAHAGWRGLLGGVLESTVASLAADADGVLAWLGPAIGPRAFEVGEEVRSAFMAAATDGEAPHTGACFAPHPDKPGHCFADLYALARLRLRRCGVEAVFGGEYCTFSDPRLFYSYRRDGRTGRMASLVGIRTSPAAIHLPT